MEINKINTMEDVEKFNPQFENVLKMILSAKQQVYSLVNTALIDLYWHIGEYISHQVESAEWGKSVVEELAAFIQRNEPNIDGFSKQNLWRMKQFYETYKEASPILSSLVREITWTNNTIIMGRCKTNEEREFSNKTLASGERNCA